MKLLASIFVTLAFVAGLPTASTAQTLVDRTYGGGQFSWDRNGSGLLYRYQAYVVDGEVVVCGAWARRGPLRDLSRQAMREASIHIEGSRVMRNISWFNAVSNASWQTELDGAETTCRGTGTAAAGVNLRSVEIVFREGRYRG